MAHLYDIKDCPAAAAQANEPQRDVMQERAIRNYPESTYLQGEWLRAVRVVRSTPTGWRLDNPVQRHA